MSAFAMVAEKSFNGRLTAKIDFPIEHLMLQLLTLPLEVSPYIIWSVFGPHAGSIWTKSYGAKYTTFGALLAKNG